LKFSNFSKVHTTQNYSCSASRKTFFEPLTLRSFTDFEARREIRAKPTELVERVLRGEAVKNFEEWQSKCPALHTRAAGKVLHEHHRMVRLQTMRRLGCCTFWWTQMHRRDYNLLQSIVVVA